MTGTDARFEDGRETPLLLKARDDDDLRVLSSLLQDAVFPASEMTWQRRQRRFAVLLNRFRWEDQPAAAREGRPVERVQSLLIVQDVRAVASQGVSPKDQETVLSLLSLQFAPGDDGTGWLTLVLAGDGAIALDVECLDVALKDVSRPYAAPSRKTPHHPEGG